MKKVLITATEQSHIAQFHKPLIKMLKKNGFEVHVAAKNNLSDKDGLQLPEPDKVFDIPFERSPLNIKNIKVFYTPHGFHFYKGAPISNWLFYYPVEKWLACYTDKIITITQEDFSLASAKFASKIYHIHGVGVNTDKYYPVSKSFKVKLRQELGYSDEQFILLCVGELNKNKNQSTVLRAVAQAITSIPQIKLLLAGNGPMEQKLKKLTDSLGLADVVDFLGYRTNLEKYLNICDVSVSASLREGLPLNVMEAMLCEKPVIASSNRGHKELVKDGITGYLLASDDNRGFCSRILELYKNEGLRNKLGRSGRHAVRPFTEERVIDELKLVYEV
ncbi:MAG: glycosyltransferase [Caldicoprobacterales bacterium]|jgi:glycosyltransferase EpsD